MPFLRASLLECAANSFCVRDDFIPFLSLILSFSLSLSACSDDEDSSGSSSSSSGSELEEQPLGGVKRKEKGVKRARSKAGSEKKKGKGRVSSGRNLCV